MRCRGLRSNWTFQTSGLFTTVLYFLVRDRRSKPIERLISHRDSTPKAAVTEKLFFRNNSEDDFQLTSRFTPSRHRSANKTPTVKSGVKLNKSADSAGKTISLSQRREKDRSASTEKRSSMATQTKLATIASQRSRPKSGKDKEQKARSRSSCQRKISELFAKQSKNDCEEIVISDSSSDPASTPDVEQSKSPKGSVSQSSAAKLLSGKQSKRSNEKSAPKSHKKSNAFHASITTKPSNRGDQSVSPGAADRRDKIKKAVVELKRLKIGLSAIAPAAVVPDNPPVIQIDSSSSGQEEKVPPTVSTPAKRKASDECGGDETKRARLSLGATRKKSTPEKKGTTNLSAPQESRLLLRPEETFTLSSDPVICDDETETNRESGKRHELKEDNKAREETHCDKNPDDVRTSLGAKEQQSRIENVEDSSTTRRNVFQKLFGSESSASDDTPRPRAEQKLSPDISDISLSDLSDAGGKQMECVTESSTASPVFGKRSVRTQPVCDPTEPVCDEGRVSEQGQDSAHKKTAATVSECERENSATEDRTNMFDKLKTDLRKIQSHTLEQKSGCLPPDCVDSDLTNASKRESHRKRTSTVKFVEYLVERDERKKKHSSDSGHDVTVIAETSDGENFPQDQSSLSLLSEKDHPAAATSDHNFFKKFPDSVRKSTGGKKTLRDTSTESESDFKTLPAKKPKKKKASLGNSAKKSGKDSTSSTRQKEPTEQRTPSTPALTTLHNNTSTGGETSAGDTSTKESSESDIDIPIIKIADERLKASMVLASQNLGPLSSVPDMIDSDCSDDEGEYFCWNGSKFPVQILWCNL